MNIGPWRSPKNPAPPRGRKIRNRADSGARTYRKPKRYSDFQAAPMRSPNGMPHSPPQKSGLYISGDFKGIGAFTPSAELIPNPNRT